MEPLSDFATADKPLRASSLPMLLKCSLRMALLHLNTYDESSGEAADTGNLVHTAVDHWHKSKDDTAALEHMRQSVERFPKGTLTEAESQVIAYIGDPRNQEAEVIASELRIQFTLQQDDQDPYGPIYIRGTLDQVRREGSRLYLWDIKTGKKYSGWDMLHIHAAQLAAYTMGACQHFQQPVYPGGIIRTHGYRVRKVVLPSPTGVFFHAPWDLADCYTLLHGVRKLVHEIRSGGAYPTSGDHCNYCPAGGLGKCLRKFEEMCIVAG